MDVQTVRLSTLVRRRDEADETIAASLIWKSGIMATFVLVAGGRSRCEEG
jgi:hypothetical protein